MILLLRKSHHAFFPQWNQTRQTGYRDNSSISSPENLSVYVTITAEAPSRVWMKKELHNQTVKKRSHTPGRTTALQRGKNQVVRTYATSRNRSFVSVTVRVA